MGFNRMSIYFTFLQNCPKLGSRLLHYISDRQALPKMYYVDCCPIAQILRAWVDAIPFSFRLKAMISHSVATAVFAQLFSELPLTETPGK